MNQIIASVLFLLLTSTCYAQNFQFTGTPSVKVSEGGSERNAERLSSAMSLSAQSRIREVDGKFFWESRGNKQLVKIESGAFITFIAPDGSGYVKIINSSLKDAASLMSSTEKNFDYTEHLILGLRTVTYYGKVN